MRHQLSQLADDQTRTDETLTASSHIVRKAQKVSIYSLRFQTGTTQRVVMNDIFRSVDQEKFICVYKSGNLLRIFHSIYSFYQIVNQLSIKKAYESMT